MRVLFVSHVSEKHGASRSLLDLIDGLLQKEVKCFVVIPKQKPSAGLMEELKNRGIEYYILPLKTWASGDKILLRRTLRAVFDLFISLLIAIRAYLWKIDIIYTNSSVISSGALAAFLIRKPHIWQIREFGPEHYGLSFTIGEPLSIRLINKLSFYIVVNSEALRRKYLQYIPAPKLKVIYDAVSVANKVFNNPGVTNDLGKFKIPTLVIVGWIYPNKGQLDALLAVSDLIDQGIQVKLKIVGNIIPKYFKELEQTIIQNKISEYVEFTGYVDNLASIYNSADIVLVCSRWEAFGRVTVEGMLFKKPIIGARSVRHSRAN